MQEVSGDRGGYLHGRGALDSDDLLYLKEQMEAEEDAERLLRRTEKRAFAAFKKAASMADSSPAPLPLPLRVEPKPKSGIRQQAVLKKVVEVIPKKPKLSNETASADQKSVTVKVILKKDDLSAFQKSGEGHLKAEETKSGNPLKSLLGSAYESSEDEED